jgi:integrase
MRNTRRKVEQVPTQKGMHYRVRVYRNGKPSVKTFKTHEEAEHFNQQVDKIGADDAIANLHIERAQTEKNKNKRQITLRNCIIQHANSLTGVNDEYRNFMLLVARQLGAIGDLRIHDIMKEDVARIVVDFEKSGNSSKTIKNKFTVVASVMKKAHQSGIINTNPCRDVRLPKLKRHPMQTLEPHEIPIFLEIMHPHYKPFTQTLFRTGLRFGEITALEVRHYNPQQQALSITQAWSDAGRKLAPPKTEHSNRTIYVPKDVNAILTNACKGKTKRDLIFTTVNGFRIRNNVYRKVWVNALKILNGDRAHRPKHITPKRFAELPIIDKHLRIHDARHTYASILVNAGTPMATVSDYLGHENFQTTAKRYSHLQPASKNTVLSALGDAP